VVRLFDEATNELVHAMRIRGTRYRPPVYNNAATYRVEIAYDDEPVSETRTGNTASVAGPPAIHYFGAVQPSILQGGTATLEWDVSAPATLTINQGVGDVMSLTVDGIGYVQVNPAADTTYTLTLNGSPSAITTVRVFAGRAAWNDVHFTPGQQDDPEIFGGNKDPDGDGFSNDEEFQFQTDPLDASSRPKLQGSVKADGATLTVDFDMSYPVDPAIARMVVEVSGTLDGWQEVPANSYVETGRENFPADGTSRVSIRLTDTVTAPEGRRFYRARWNLP
jgi:hypothetical protein